MAPFPRMQKFEDPNTYKIQPRAYVLVLVIVYAGFSLTAWITLCILNERPIGKPSYDVQVVEDDDFENLQREVEKWYRAARFISGVVGVLALPLTSAVCASAAVNYTQVRNARWSRNNLTLKQTVTLANKGWTSPLVLFALPFKFRALGSSFLYFTIALHIFGGLINPLQQVFLNQDVAHVRREVVQYGDFNDVSELASPERLQAKDDGRTTAVLRALLSSTPRNDSSQYLWRGQSNNCTEDFQSPHSVLRVSSIFDCIPSPWDDEQYRHYWKSPSPDLFVAQLSPEFNSGAIRQYAPRLNSSIKHEGLDRDDFPDDCPGNSFYRNYTAVLAGPNYYYLSVCMPGNLSASPFRQTRGRYDFEEALYVTMLSGGRSNWTTFKLTLSATVGYFEVPNSKNGNTPGPVLAKDPNITCALPNCVPQLGESLAPVINRHEVNTTELSFLDVHPGDDSNPGRPNLGYDDYGKFYLELIPSKGPLALLTIAMFGNSSYIETRFRPENWNRSDDNPGPTVCVEYGPLSLLSLSPDCDLDYGTDAIGKWLSIFVNGNLYSLFNEAAFLANQAILTQTGLNVKIDTLHIYSQPTQPIAEPAMSKAVMIVISVLQAVYLLCLLAISAWVSIRIGWTDSLDAYAMLKIGAALATDSFHSDAIREGKENVLDKLPGWVGEEDATAATGRLVVGGKAPLKWKRRYWKGNDMSLQIDRLNDETYLILDVGLLIVLIFVIVGLYV